MVWDLFANRPWLEREMTLVVYQSLATQGIRLDTFRPCPRWDLERDASCLDLDFERWVASHRPMSLFRTRRRRRFVLVAGALFWIAGGVCITTWPADGVGIFATLLMTGLVVMLVAMVSPDPVMG